MKLDIEINKLPNGVEINTWTVRTGKRKLAVQKESCGCEILTYSSWDGEIEIVWRPRSSDPNCQEFGHFDIWSGPPLEEMDPTEREILLTLVSSASDHADPPTDSMGMTAENKADFLRDLTDSQP